MRLKSLGFSLATVTALCLAAAPAQAQGQGHGKDHDNDHGHAAAAHNGHGHSAATADDDHDNRGVRGDDDDRGARVDRGDQDDRGDEASNRDHRPGVPPGLAKKGGVPPGLAKKGGYPPGQANRRYNTDEGAGTLRDILAQHGYTIVRSSNNGSYRDVYYRYHNGTLHRAIVAPGTNQLSFRNVPSSVLRDLKARLYH